MSYRVALKILQDYIRLNNLRYTPQREEILKIFLETKGHITAEELYKKVNEQFSEIGVATVRRSLNLFVDCKIASRIKFGDNKSVYEPSYAHHDHLICVQCGKIIEFNNERIEELQQRVANENNFIINHHKLVIYGLCQDCSKENA